MNSVCLNNGPVRIEKGRDKVTDSPQLDFEKLLSQRSLRFGQATYSNPRRLEGRIPLSSGYPDPSSMPKADMAEATRLALEKDGELALQYGATRGFDRLLEQLQTKLKRDQGIDCSEEELLIVTGAGQGLGIIAEAFSDPGDVVISEEPTWMGAVRLFRGLGVDVEPLPVDDQGPDVGHLEKTITRLEVEGRKPKLIYTIPTFQNPVGVTASLERRQAVVELAKKHMIPVIEDDAYSDLRFRGERLPTMYQLDDSGMVVYLSTFSKIIGAGLRLGWIVAHPRLINAFAPLKQEGGTSPFVGAAVSEFCASGTLVEHIDELRTVYSGRHSAMINALKKYMPDGVTWSDPEGGFFVWVMLPSDITVSSLQPALQEAKVDVSPGTQFHFHGGGANAMRLSFSFADEEQIDAGIKALGDAIRSVSA
jgi:2-aminoadipate transaminase